MNNEQITTNGTASRVVTAEEMDLLKRLSEADKIRDLAEAVLVEDHNTDQDGGHKHNDEGKKEECLRCDLERDLAVKLIQYRRVFDYDYKNGPLPF